MASGSTSGSSGAGPLSAFAGFLWGKLGDVLDGPFRALQRHIGANRMAYVFLVPNILVFGLFSFWPMILNFYIAFTGGQSVLLTERPFVGLDNFRELLNCPNYLDPKTCQVTGFSFWTGIWNTLFFAAVQVPIMIVVALVTAIILNRDIRARGFWRAVYFYPVMLSPVVVAVIWDWVLKRRGILNALISDGVDGWNRFAASSTFPLIMAVALFLVLAKPIYRLMQRVSPKSAWIFVLPLAIFAAKLLADFVFTGARLTMPDYRPINWLIDIRSGWPMFWVIFVYTWGHLGFYMLILLAGLQAIPRDLYEAAEMDGTSKSRQFWRITLPLLMPTMIVVLVLSLIRAFQVFDEVYVLTGGGPGQATKMIIQHIYESAFIGDAKRYGIAAASSVLVAGVLLVLTLIQLFATRKKAG